MMFLNKDSEGRLLKRKYVSTKRQLRTAVQAREESETRLPGMSIGRSILESRLA